MFWVLEIQSKKKKKKVNNFLVPGSLQLTGREMNEWGFQKLISAKTIQEWYD